MYRTVFAFLMLFGVAHGLPGDHLKKGQVFPSFTAVDQQGEQRESSQLLGPQGAVLVIFRSADW